MRNKKLFWVLITIALITTACSGVSPAAVPAEAQETKAQASVSEEPANTSVQLADSSTEAETSTETETNANAIVVEDAAAEETKEEGTTTEESTSRVAKNGKPLLDDQPRSPFESYWATDFSLHTVPYSEIISGGPPRDGIPPIDNPKFISIDEAATWLEDQEPIFVVSINDETKGYPLQILTWHEVVNDTVGGEPVTVTFCPLCNSAITFKRTLNGTVYDFGVSGKLRNSDLIMWDRQTQSWWQQLTGEAIVGELVGRQLTFVPTRLISFGDFKESFPDAQVLSRDTGFNRPYGRNPYAGYDRSPSPFLFAGRPDPRLEATERVVTVDLNDEFVAYPYGVLAEAHVVADQVGGEDVVVFWQGGTTSALDQSNIADSKDVGAAAVYSPIVDGQKLSFAWDGTNFVDEQTNSRWNLLGEAIEGELAGQQLTPILHANHFWFAWAAFRPDTRIYSP
jgi:hypothetical protein